MIYSRDYSFVEIEAQNEEQARKYFEEGARRSPYQKELDTRVYRKINGYLSPKKIFKDLAFFLFTLDTTILTMSRNDDISIDDAVEKYLMPDNVTVNSFLVIRTWLDGKYPLFCLDKDLAKAFLNTNQPKNLPDIKPFAKCGILLLPQGLIKNPDGEEVNSLVFNFVESGELIVKDFLATTIGSSPSSYPNLIGASFKAGDYSYFIETVAQNAQNYTAGSPIGEARFSEEIKNNEEILTSELEFTEQIRSLVIQTFLYQQTYHADARYLIKDSERKSPRHPKPSSNKPRSPIIIGADYKVKRISLKKGGTHASPTTHWRSGHWRNQPFGSKENPQYKTIWLEPMLVNG